jgi:hypothetical protein
MNQAGIRLQKDGNVFLEPPSSEEAMTLKGQWHENFDPRFFNQTIPHRALITGQKPVRIWLRICREYRDNHLKSSDSEVSMTPLDMTWTF